MALIVIILSILLASCSSANPDDPVSIVQTAYNRLNKGNTVTYTSQVYHGDRLLATYNDGLDVVVDGKIIFDGRKEYLPEECKTHPSQAYCAGN